jgi:hypothetical protein
MRYRILVAVAALAFLTSAGAAQRSGAFAESRDHPAIAYGSIAPDDPVARLNRRLETSETTLAFQPDTGYLRPVLDALGVPIESQSLVFSQTSFQASVIGMRNPRALFFNDAVAVGWVRGAAVLEVAALDPRQGAIFYTIEQDAGAPPRFTRNDQCLACHLSWDTLGVPGLLMMSTLPRPDEDAYASGFVTDHRSPFSERWSGWYVTGVAGSRHLGNRPVAPAELRRPTIAVPARPVKSLEGVFDLTGYPTPHSDVAALMVLAHQTHMTNLLTRLGWEARVADRGGIGAETRVREAAVDVVDYMLFVDEPALAAPVEGSSGFARLFASGGPRDAQGRSLRELDLRRRLMRYPCSYMIYSETFDALPPAARDAVFARMWRVLSGGEQDPKYSRLSALDRQAVLEILRATKTNLPDYFLTSKTVTVAK